MTMNGDGNELYVRSARADGNVYLTTLDTSSGETVSTRETLRTPSMKGASSMGASRTSPGRDSSKEH